MYRLANEQVFFLNAFAYLMGKGDSILFCVTIEREVVYGNN